MNNDLLGIVACSIGIGYIAHKIINNYSISDKYIQNNVTQYISIDDKYPVADRIKHENIYNNDDGKIYNNDYGKIHLPKSSFDGNTEENIRNEYIQHEYIQHESRVNGTMDDYISLQLIGILENLLVTALKTKNN